MSRWTRLMSGGEPEPDDLWVRTVQRLDRAVGRYESQVAMVRDRRLRIELQDFGEILFQALADVERLATPTDPRQDHITIPLTAQRAVMRAATLTAHATEAAMMAADARWNNEPDGVQRCLDTVRTLVKAVRELADACLEATR
jgi:hypothetical protein